MSAIEIKHLDELKK